LAVLVGFLTIPASEFEAAFGKIGLGYLSYMLVLSIGNLFVTSLRLYIVANQSHDQVTLLGFFRVYVVGRLMNSLIPQGGVFYRGWALKQEAWMACKTYAIVFSGFGWLSVATALVITAVVLSLRDQELLLFGHDGQLIIIGLLFFSLLVPGLLKGLVALLPSRGKVAGRFVTTVTSLAESVRALLTDCTLFVKFLSLSAVSFLLVAFFYAIAFENIGVSIRLSELLVFASLMKYVGLVQMTPGNLGVQEFLAGFLGQATGSTVAVGVVAGLQASVVSFLGVLLLSMKLLATKSAVLSNPAARNQGFPENQIDGGFEKRK
jgi:hypothetical protein